MTGRIDQSDRRSYRTVCAALVACAALQCVASAKAAPPAASGDGDVVRLSADMATEWQDAGGSGILLRGHCRILQGSKTLTARQMVIWRHVSEAGGSTREVLSVYLEGDCRFEQPGSTRNESSLFVTLNTREQPQASFGRLRSVDGPPPGPLYQRALQRRGLAGAGVAELTPPGVRPTEFRQPGSLQSGPLPPGAVSPAMAQTGTVSAGQMPSPLTQSGFSRPAVGMPDVLSGAGRSSVEQVQYSADSAPPAGPEIRAVQLPLESTTMRRVRVFPRSAVPYNVLSFESTQSVPAEQVWVLTGGVNLIVDGLDSLGTVDLAADRMVIWTRAGMSERFRAETVQSRDTPFQVYLEGNIVVRQGQNVLRATSGVYDARDDRALLMNAELRTFVPQLQGDLRIRADRIRQLSRDRYYARNAWTSGSQFGKPGYRLRASEVFLESRAVRPWIGPGARPTGVDPVTGAPVFNKVPYIRSRNNTFLVEDVPLLYSPYLAAPADDPNIPLRRLTFQQDDIFGTQVRTTWDMYKLLGLDPPDGTVWDLQADLLGDRGPAAGTAIEYGGAELFGIPGLYRGRGLIYYINDGGTDNLGLDRRALDPAKTNRFRVQHRHRHDVTDDLTILSEIGWLSDRNFLEQYYEDEFDEQKDVETLVYVRQQFDNWALTALGRPQLNNFETTTEWLPRGDLYGLGQPLAGGWLTWSSHSSAGYGRLQPGEAPDDPTDLYTAPAWYSTTAEGAVLMTRHELNAPFMLGPFNVVPFAMGEAAFWGDDGTGDSIDRLIGSAGIRSSLSFSRVFPYVTSRIFNLSGLAHKVRLEADYVFTDSTADLASIPLYNEFDDNAQERFRARLMTNTFGGTLPPQFDPRMYALRTGAGHSITAPWHELVDDQQVVRLAIRQRLQTKVGPPERLRIRDWMTLDLEASFFPNEDRDNFGEPFGLLGSRYRWNLSDRTSFIASSFYDPFDDGQQLWNAGVNSQRSARGSVYLGVRQVKGAGLDSQIVTASATYMMSPKWVGTVGTAYDLKEERNAGQSLTITRVGADFLMHLGASFDESKNNAGIALSIEPRFGPFGGSNSRLSSLLQGR